MSLQHEPRRISSRSRSRSPTRTPLVIKPALEIIVGDWVEYKKETLLWEYDDSYGKVVEIERAQGALSPALEDKWKIFDQGNFPETWKWQHEDWVERSKVRFVHKGLYEENKHVRRAGGYRNFGE